MIYIDTSVVLAQLLAGDRLPPRSLWDGPLVCSRLLEYETWTAINGRGLARSHGEAAQQLLARVSLLELSPVVLTRALEPFPVRVRTIDALHLASASFLHERRVAISIATYDGRLAEAARALGFELHDLSA